jgi:fibronectin type 3 domain-containing protein
VRRFQGWRRAAAEELESRVLLATTKSLISILPDEGQQAKITSSDTTITTTHTIRAGLPLHVAAADLSGLPDRLDAQYEWDFGDPNGRYNILPGFNAAHVFDVPRSTPYDVKLKITVGSAGAATAYESAPLKVTVTADTRTKIYLGAPDPNCNCGDGTKNNPYKRMSEALSRAYALGGNVRLILMRGQDYPLGQVIDLTQLHNTTFEDEAGWGSGDLPALDGSALTSKFTQTWDDPGNENIVFRNIEFMGSATNRRDVLHVRGRNYALIGCRFVNVAGVVVNEGDYFRSRGLLVQDSEVPAHPNHPSDSYLGRHFVVAQSDDIALLGNRVQGSKEENVIRFNISTHDFIDDDPADPNNEVRAGAGPERVLIYGNDLINEPANKGTLTLQVGSHFYVAANRLTHGSTAAGTGSLRFGPQGHCDGSPTSGECATHSGGSGNDPDLFHRSERLEWAIAERNFLNDVNAEVTEGSKGVVFRNNVTRLSGGNIFTVEGYSTVYRRPTEDVRIVHNTGINTGSTSATFLRLHKPEFNRTDYPAPDGQTFAPGTTPNGITLVNNLYVAPASTSYNNVLIDAADLRSIKKSVGNVWAVSQWFRWGGASHPLNTAGTNIGWNQTVPPDPNDTAATVSVAGFTPSGGSAGAVNVGTSAAGVFIDYYGSARRGTAGSRTVGAVQVPPMPPTSLTATGAAGGITLQWTRPTSRAWGDGAFGTNKFGEHNVSAWEVYRSTSSAGPWTTLTTNWTSTTYNDTTAPAGQTSYYQVKAKDAGGNVSTPATANAVRPGSTTVPPAPTNLSASAPSPNRVNLAWTDASGNETGFKIQRRLASSGTWSQIATTSANAITYSDLTVSAGTQYVYRVLATNDAGDSAASNEAPVTTPPATTLSIDVANTSSDTEPDPWTDSQGRVWEGDRGFTGGSVLTSSYDVQGTTDDRLYYTRRYGPNGASFTYALAVANGTYDLRLHFAESNTAIAAGQRVFDVLAEGAVVVDNYDIVSAAGGVQRAVVKTVQVAVADGTLNLEFRGELVGGAPADPVVSGIQLDPAATPAAPTGLTASAGDSQVTLSWNAVSGATSYNVYRSTTSGGNYVRANASAVTSTTFVDTGLSDGTTYYYVVRAVNPAGEGAASAEVSATPRAQNGGTHLAAFTGGNGTDSVDQYRGTPGDGWQTAWGTTAYVENSVAQAQVTGDRVVAPGDAGFAALNAGGPYLSATLQGLGAVAAGHQGSVYRGYATAGEVDTSKAHQISFDYRFEGFRLSGADSMSDLNDRVVVFGDAQGFHGTNTTNTWVVAAYGAANAGVAARTWTFHNGDRAGGTTLVNTGVPLVEGRVYHFVIDVDPVTKSFKASVSDGQSGAGHTYSSGTLGWRSNTTFTSATAQFINFNARVSSANETAKFAVDSVAVGPSVTSLDVPSTLPAGQTTVVTAGRDYDVRGAGSNVNLSSDSFRFAYLRKSGDFDVRVRLESVERFDDFTKAGLMARVSLDAASAHATMFANPNGDFNFRARATSGGSTISNSHNGIGTMPNMWVRLVRTGGTVEAFRSADGETWFTDNDWTWTVPAGVTDLYVGMAVMSHSSTALVTAKFRDLAFA